MWPCWWSAGLAATAQGAQWPNPWHLALFFVGAHVMRAAGCAWNDYLDRDIDKLVERTKTRPLASGALTGRAGLIFMVLLATVGLIILLQFNRFTILLGVLSLLPVAVYPLMKRITYWPQSVLGLAFGWGALMGWAAAFGTLGWPPLVLYAATILWIIGYDTIYAHQDREDDALIGVKSTALRFGASSPVWVAGFYAGFWVLLVAAGVRAGAGGLLWWAAMAIVAGILAWQVVTLDIDDPASCLGRFRANHWVGLVVFLGMLGGAV